MMKLPVSLSFIVLLFSACSNIQKDKKTSTSIDSNVHIQYPDTPDFQKHIKPLFSFFALRQRLPAFDTDIDFYDQGFGAIDNYFNFIKAGHIFSKTQDHAIIFYDFGIKNYRPLARLLIYKRNDINNRWYRVLDDTISVATLHYKFRDWNSDGIADLSCVWNGWDHGGHGPVSWQLWLVDKQGVPHAVKGFEDINDPKIDSFTNHIFSNIEHHTGKETAEYKFAGNRIMKISDDMFVDYDTPNVVTHYRNNKEIRKVKLKGHEVIYTPKYDSEDY